MATKPKVGQIKATQPRFEYVDDSEGEFDGARFYSRQPQQEPVPEKTGFIRGAGDNALALGQGVVGGVKMLSDLAGPDNAVSQTLGKANEGMQSLYSPARAEEMKKRQALIQAADDSGSTVQQITSRLGGIAEAPLQTTLQAAGSMAPNIAAAIATGGVSAGPSVLATAARIGVPAALGVGMGVGSVKGQNYEAVLQKAKQEGMTDEQAHALAVQASEYSAANAPQQALGGALGVLDSLTGAERFVSGMARKGVKAEATHGAIRRGVMGGLEEAGPEGLQGAQGQYAQNEAMNRAGFKTDPWAGVVGQGVNDAVVGSFVGAPVGAMNGSRKAPQQAQAAMPEPVPEVGTLSKAANVGIATAGPVPVAPPPVAMSTEQEQTLLALANGRNKALTDKANGTKDVKTTAEDGTPVTIPGQQPEFLTPAEKEEQAFLAQNGGDVQALARAYPGVLATPEVEELPVQAPATAPAPVEELPPAPAVLGAPSAEAYAQREQDRPAEPTNAVLPGDILTPTGNPFKNMAAAMAAQKRAGDTHEIVLVAGGLVVRQKATTDGTSIQTAGLDRPAATGQDSEPAGGPIAPVVEPASGQTGAIQDNPGLAGGSGQALAVPLAGTGSAAVAPSGNSSTPDGHIRDEQGNWADPKKVYTDMLANGWKAVSPKAGGNLELRKDGETHVSVANSHADMVRTLANADPVNADWDSMPHAERNALAAKTGMAKAIADKIAGKPWAEITAKTRARIESAMAAPVSDMQTADAPVVSKPATKAKKQDKTRGPRIAAYDKNPLLTFIATHGLYHDKDQPGSLKSEFSPDKGLMVPGYGPVFKKTGKRLDALVQNAIEDGYLPKDGTEQQLYSLIQRAVGGEKITPQYAEGVAESEAQAQMDARAELEQEQHSQDNSEPATADEIEAALDAEMEASDAEFFAVDDSDIPWDAPGNSSTEAFLRAMGATEQEIRDGLAQEQNGQSSSNQAGAGTQEAIPGAAQAGNGGRSPQAGDSVAARPGGSDSEGLTAPTRGDVLAQQERADKADKAAAKAKADAGNKAKADAERNEFTLTGSDRPADVGAAGGQTDIFGQPDKPAASANTIFTEDAAEKARAILKAKLRNLNTGLDPEMMQAGITLAGYHIEKGARTFAAYAKAMLSDLGDGVKPYLKSWYNALRDYPGFDAGGMTEYSVVSNADLEVMLGEVSDTGLSKPSSDGIPMIAGLFADFPQRKSLIEKGFDSLDISEQRSVLAQMRLGIQDDKVFNSVIQAVPVDVMNVLIGEKFSTNDLLHQKAMLTGSLSIPANTAIPVPVISFVDSVAALAFGKGTFSTAKGSSRGGYLGGASVSSGSTTDTGNGGQSNSPVVEENGTSGNYDQQPQMVEHVTGKGKTLRGVVRTDLSLSEAKAIDKFTFKKDGGYFIREEHLDALNAAHPTSAATPQAAEPTPHPAGTLTNFLLAKIESGNMPKDNPALRKMVESFDDKPATPERMKEAQEAMEAAIVRSARLVVAKNEGPRSTFDALVRLYASQPNLNIRTSTSIENQAYSTPAPLAFVASELAGITQKSTVFEPTAGNGMLLIGAKIGNSSTNELNDDRVAALRDQGFKPTQVDATREFIGQQGQHDRVVANPPFGPIKDKDGNSIKVKFDGYTLGQIDHLIAARALQTMKDDGGATLIIGANKVTGEQSNNDLIFFNWLYGNYNVTSHFEVDGDLYQRQGAAWPVRVITIQGRFKSSTTAPAPGTIQRATTWSEVYERFQDSLGAQRAPSQPSTGTVRTSTGTNTNDAGPVPITSGGQAGNANQGRASGGTGGNGNVSGAGTGVLRDSPTEPSGRMGKPDSGGRHPDAATGKRDATGDSGAGTGTKSASSSGGASLAADTENQFQAKYTPRSARKDEGVLIPVNMADPTQDALNRLEDEVGDIDEFARDELGYKSVADLHDALMGLQVDSVASAINQIKKGKGVIIADQTGIGKGRQAAAIIRWAAMNGKTPVFVTVKPSLFTDMYGDLHDIGTDDVAPFILNKDESIKGKADEKLFGNKANTHTATMTKIANTGELPQGSNALFMTYSQINTDNIQRKAVLSLAPNAVFVLDESHNAGGESSTGAFIRSALGLAHGVTYLSATYAKRPDNMPVYFKTDIGEAVADDATLMNAMAQGGLPLQTVVANNLVKAGQMFRRERSFNGVSIESRADTEHRAEHVAMSDKATEALRAIVAADSAFHNIYVKALQKETKASGERVMDVAGNQAKASVDHTQFSSIAHNFVRQMLLGLKAQESANDAIRSIKRGEKPIIAVENTMGSFLNEYAEKNGLSEGDALGTYSYRTVLSRALERSRVITVQDKKGLKTKVPVPLSKLDPVSYAAYAAAQKVIDALDVSIPASPIDWMRQEIINAGFTVAEITGRNLSVDYSDPKNPKLSQIDTLEQKDKVRTTRQFNSGALDALILNVAGSTGISLHASEKFKDQRQRHMIVAQAAQDINIFMQMLGRIHRTGQVKLPKYTLLSADLPAEIRPTALLSGKMKSLNANTSSNTESATSVKASDMLNKYGDQVVAQYLRDNQELALAMGLDVPGENGDGSDDIARKTTGRLALMPVKVQEQFYAEIEEQYTALIDYLNKTNQNELEPKTFDFDAQETRSDTLFEGKNKASPFGQDAAYGEYSVKAQGKAMTPAEIRAAMAEHLGGKTAAQHLEALQEKLHAEYRSFIAKTPDENKEGAGIARANALRFLREHKIGDMFRVEINQENYNAIITNVRNTHKAAGNPYAMSKFQVTVAVNGSLRSVTVPATQFTRIEVSGVSGYAQSAIDQLFKVGAVNERETAKIVTGNLLGAYGEMDGGRGQIIAFTKSDGTTEQGILLPKSFNFAKDVRQDYRIKTPAELFKFVTESSNENIGKFGVNSRDNTVRVMPSGRDAITIQVPKSKAQGGKYFLDKDLLAATGDFTSSGNYMRATVEGKAASIAALEVLMKKQALYALPSMAEEAREILGDPKPQAPTAFSRSALPTNAKGQPVAKVEALVQFITSRWANAPKVVVVQSLDDPRVPADIAAAAREFAATPTKDKAGSAEGFIDKDTNTVFLIADMLAGDADVVRVLMHESLGHFGLRGLYGALLGTILDRMAVLNADKVKHAAKRLGLDYENRSQRRLAAEEVLSYMAQNTPELGWVKKTVAAIRTWARDHIPGFGKMRMSDDELIRNFIIPARNWVEKGGPDGGGGGNSSKRKADLSGNSSTSTSYSRDQTGQPYRSAWDAVAEMWQKLSEHDSLFRYPKSDSKDFVKILAAIDQSLVVLPPVVNNGQMMFRIQSRDPAFKGYAAVTVTGKEVKLDVSKWGKGESGSRIYAAVGNWTFNTDRVFNEDDALTETSLFRRTENMLSLALKFGTTRHIAPGKFLRAGSKALGIGPLQWTAGNDAANMNALLKTSYESMTANIPALDGLRFNFEKGVFQDATGAEVTRTGFTATAASDDARRANAGEGTIARTILTQSFLREENAGRGRSVLALMGRWGNLPPFHADTTDAQGSGDIQGLEGIAYSRGLGASLSSGLNNVREVGLPAGYVVGDLFQGEGRLHWWHKSVGSMYHLAQKSAPFKRVYDSIQNFLNDVSFYAAESADLAPSILPKLDKIGDVFKSPLSPEDTKALSAPVFEGTLAWGRNKHGVAMPSEDIEAELGETSLDDKAHMLMRAGHIDPKVLKMWQGLPMEQYEAIINGKFETQFMKPGVVFTPAELKEHFKMTDAQVALYQEFRKATDKSIDNLAISEMLNYAGKDAAPIREQVLESSSVSEAGQTLRDYLVSLVELEPKRDEALSATAAKVLDIAAHAQDMKDRGYAPLSRFGNYTLEATLATGERYFSLFETDRERNKAARMLLGEKATDMKTGTMSQESYKLLNGVSPETAALFGEMLGLESQGSEAKDLAFQEFIKRGTANRSAMKRLLKRKGIVGFSEDSGRVLAGFLYSNARRTASNLHTKETSQAVSDIPKEQGELKDAAVKLQEYVSNPQEEAQAFRGLLFAQYLGGSVASAMVNATQPFTTTLPYLSQFGGVRKAGAQMLAAVRDAAQMEAGLKTTTGNAALDAALKKAEEEGIVSPQGVHQLMAQAMGRATLESGDGTTMGNSLAKGSNALSKLSMAWGKVFGVAEQFNRRTTFIAAYRTAIEQGIADPAKFAEKAVNETQFVSNKGNKPRWARGAVGSVLFTFKSYSVNYLELVTRMANAGEPGSAERKAGQKAAVLAIAVLFLMAGADGLPFVEDIEDVIDGAMQRLGYNFSSKQQMKTFLTLQLGKDGAEFVMSGVSGLPGAPIDVSGRLSMGNLIPGTGLLQKKDNYTRDLQELLGPGGDMVKRSYTAAGQALSGNITSAMTTIAPSAARNVVKAIDMADTGMYRDDKGRKVIDTDTGEALAKAIGFQPRSVKNVQEASMEVQKAKTQYILASGEIRAAMAQAIFMNDADMRQRARDALAAWNEKNPDQRMTLDMPAVLRKVREMRRGKEQRMADTAPKAIRAQVREQLKEELH